MNNKPKEKIKIISERKFIILCILTFGLYKIWWIYKSWRFFSYKDKLNVNSATRTLFSFIFLIPLFQRIKKYSSQLQVNIRYSSVVLFILLFIADFLVSISGSLWVISIFSFVFLLKPVNSLNRTILKDSNFEVSEAKKFNYRQIAIMGFGIICWIFLFIGWVQSFQNDSEYATYTISKEKFDEIMK
ncbi:hypothetical protein [Carboxylicivirga caseinilyticus]|uniref:hypothetical protein n=1 Tax=Carboxylicivirga caseinilyticus TaxID=3417572 RepID=UPI003D330106|nr:hypothetical protein [Marinilabiliaceae bacterium A049]